MQNPAFRQSQSGDRRGTKANISMSKLNILLLECHVCLCASLAGRRFIPLLLGWAAAKRSVACVHAHKRTPTTINYSALSLVLKEKLLALKQPTLPTVIALPYAFVNINYAYAQKY